MNKRKLESDILYNMNYMEIKYASIQMARNNFKMECNIYGLFILFDIELCNSPFFFTCKSNYDISVQFLVMRLCAGCR